jgi:hypothetical protein
MRASQRVISLAVLGVLAGTSPVRAEVATAEEGPPFPNIHGEILVEIHSDADPDSGHGDQFLKVEPALSIGLSEHFSIEAGFVLEPVSDPPPGRDRWFDDEGLFVETLFLRWQRGRFALHAGKFNPSFGFAWDLAPGIYGVDFAEDYEITERIGFGGVIEFGNAAVGRHRLGVDAFFVDTSPLSRSLLHDRGRTRRSDGGPSNTLSPESFSITLRGGEIPRLPGLTYNLGFANQHRADVGGRSERDAVAGLAYGFSPFEGFEIELLSEYAHLHHAEGANERRHYFTQSAAASWAGWNVALSYTGRWIHGRDDGSLRDFLFQASAGYAWEIGAGGRLGVLGADVGWRCAREEGARGDGFGALVSYTLPF